MFVRSAVAAGRLSCSMSLWHLPALTVFCVKCLCNDFCHLGHFHRFPPRDTMHSADYAVARCLFPQGFKELSRGGNLCPW